MEILKDGEEIDISLEELETLVLMAKHNCSWERAAVYQENPGAPEEWIETFAGPDEGAAHVSKVRPMGIERTYRKDSDTALLAVSVYSPLLGKMDADAWSGLTYRQLEQRTGFATAHLPYWDILQVPVLRAWVESHGWLF